MSQIKSEVGDHQYQKKEGSHLCLLGLQLTIEEPVLDACQNKDGLCKAKCSVQSWIMFVFIAGRLFIYIYTSFIFWCLVKNNHSS